MSSDRDGRWLRSAARWGGALAVLVALTLVSYLAGTQAIVPPRLPVSEAASTSYQVEVGEVASSLRLAVTAAWSTAQSVSARSSGVMTTVVGHRDGLVRPGDVLATVDLRPIVSAAGSVPMFRDLREGVRGRDVRQVEALLADLGYLKAKPDSVFRAATTAAVKRWQRRLGLKADGVVRAGDVVFIARLPARIAMRVGVGDTLSPGGPLLDVLRGTPTFTAFANPTERAQLSTGMSVDVVGAHGEAWPAEITTFVPTDDGRFATALEGTLCPDPCTALAPVGETALWCTVVIQAPVSGPVVPQSAITQDPNGGLSVSTPAGDVIPVTIVGAADGFAVVKGLPAGTVIRLPEAGPGD